MNYSSYSKYQKTQQESTTRYTSNKHTDWHKKYEPKDPYLCQPDLKFQIQSYGYQVQNRRRSDYTVSQPVSRNCTPIQQITPKFDTLNFVNRLRRRLDS